MLALAERWRQRFGLVYDPRSKAERGDRLAGGSPWPPLRKSQAPSYASAASVTEAFGAVLDECLAQIIHNAIGLYAGNPALRAEHVHQLRVGIRRLRSALRSFAGWVPATPLHLVEALRTLFVALGQYRDVDVMAGGVEADLTRVGAPPLNWAPPSTPPDAVATIAAPQTQQALLAWIAWRAALFAPATARAPSTVSPTSHEFHRLAAKRLKKWHARIAADLVNFDGMDETALHALRKRIKRQRYALEFFAPLLRATQVRKYLRALAALQDDMGRLNDLFVARARYQAMLASAPAAWFALGWLAARIEVVHAEAQPNLARLAKTAVPHS
jgi:CHAD domain-containing protein